MPVTVIGERSLCPYLDPQAFLLYCLPVLLGRGSDRTAWWAAKVTPPVSFYQAPCPYFLILAYVSCSPSLLKLFSYLSIPIFLNSCLCFLNPVTCQIFLLLSLCLPDLILISCLCFLYSVAFQIFFICLSIHLLVFNS